MLTPMLVSDLSHGRAAVRGADLTLPTEGRPANRSQREVQRTQKIESFEKLVKSPISKDFFTCRYGSLGSAVVSRE